MSERERIEVWDCDCGIVNDVVDEECIVCEQPRQTIITPPPRDWKPVAGERVLVEATIDCGYTASDGIPFVRIEAYPKGYYVFSVPLSSIHPMPGKKKCPVGCVCQSCLSE